MVVIVVNMHTKMFVGILKSIIHRVLFSMFMIKEKEVENFVT